MATHTAFARAELVGILSDYDLGAYVRSSKLSDGIVQTNLLIETGCGKSVLKYYETRSASYALFEIDVLRYLARHSFPSPAPIRDARGGFLGVHKGKPFALFTFMEGKKRDDAGKDIARALSRLHRITKGYRPRHHGVRDKYDPAACRKAAKRNASRLPPEEARMRLRWVDSELRSVCILRTLPKGVCHCDTHPSNFLFTDGKLSAVLDFDDASYVPLAYDVANLLYFWAWPPEGGFDPAEARRLISEYQRGRRLGTAEKRHLYDLLKMVILMSAAWFLNVDEDYAEERERIEYLNTIGRDSFREMIFGENA